MYIKSAKRLMKLMPREAEKLLILNNFESQRPLKPRKINDLAKIIRDGLFLIGEIGIATLSYKNNERVLMNGQHQCSACIQANTPIEVVYEEYVCPTPEDASLLFRQFDNAGVRALSDKVKVEMDCLNLDWPKKVGSLVVAAVSYHKDMSANDKVELLKNNMNFGEFVFRIFSPDGDSLDKEANHLRRLPVVYAMLQTYTKHQEQSDVFWMQVRNGEGLTRSMPAYKLRNYLLTHNYGYGRGASGMQIASFHEMISKCITAWNAFRKGVTTDLKYYQDKQIPKAV